MTVNGVACSEETVLDGSYEIQRPFVLVTKSDASLSTAAQAFFDYATSKDASELVRNARRGSCGGITKRFTQADAGLLPLGGRVRTRLPYGFVGERRSFPWKKH